MQLVDRALRFSRANPVVFAPLLVHWVIQCAFGVAASRLSGTAAGVWLETAVGLTWLAFPLFLAATEALIIRGLELGRANYRHLVGRTLALSWRAVLPLVFLLTLAGSAWRMSALAGGAFFFGTALLFSFFPEALFHEKSLQQALERSLGLLEDHPLECLAATGTVVAFGLATSALGLWHLEGAADFDLHMPGMTSLLMVPAIVAAVAIMVFRDMLYERVRLTHAVGINANW
ncbi:MAG: hypothetical protein ACM3ZA_04115 [Bacillota bacterium]